MVVAGGIRETRVAAGGSAGQGGRDSAGGIGGNRTTSAPVTRQWPSLFSMPHDCLPTWSLQACTLHIRAARCTIACAAPPCRGGVMVRRWRGNELAEVDTTRTDLNEIDLIVMLDASRCCNNIGVGPPPRSK